MSAGVLITLIICTTIIIIFGVALIGSSQSKQEKDNLSEALRERNVSDWEIDMIIKEERDNK